MEGDADPPGAGGAPVGVEGEGHGGGVVQYGSVALAPPATERPVREHGADARQPDDEPGGARRPGRMGPEPEAGQAALVVQRARHVPSCSDGDEPPEPGRDGDLPRDAQKRRRRWQGAPCWPAVLTEENLTGDPGRAVGRRRDVVPAGEGRVALQDGAGGVVARWRPSYRDRGRPEGARSCPSRMTAPSARTAQTLLQPALTLLTGPRSAGTSSSPSSVKRPRASWRQQVTVRSGRTAQANPQPTVTATAGPATTWTAPGSFSSQHATCPSARTAHHSLPHAASGSSAVAEIVRGTDHSSIPGAQPAMARRSASGAARGGDTSRSIPGRGRRSVRGACEYLNACAVQAPGGKRRRGAGPRLIHFR